MSAELGVHVPGQAYLFTQPIEMRFNEILEGTRADIAVKIFGDDYAEIERIAGEVREILEKVPGAADVEFDALGRAPLLEITPIGRRWPIQSPRGRNQPSRRDRARRRGSRHDHRRQPPLSHHRTAAEELRRKVDEMKKLPLRTSDDGLVTLGQVAEFKVGRRSTRSLVRWASAARPSW